jgi:5'(3')-deoxyribonucleotidase
MNRIFIDMDGVIVNFDALKRKLNLGPGELKKRPGAYLEMEPYPDAIPAVTGLINAGYDVFIATKPPTGVPFAYADKVSWVLKYLPELARKIIITSDKGLLGDEGDILIDDRPHKANCEQFKGHLIRVPDDNPNWIDILAQVRNITCSKKLDNCSGMC